MNSTETRCSVIAGNSCLGPACSSSREQAPARIGTGRRPPSPKVKPSGGLPVKTSSSQGGQHVLREGVRYGQHIPVEVHTAFGAAGGAGGEGDQRDVVGGRVDRRERLVRGARDAQQQVVGRVPAVRRDPQPRDLRLRQVVDRPYVAQRVGDVGDGAHGGQLVRALLGEHRDGDPARLQDRQPARGEPGCGGPAQQHPVAGHDAQFGGQDVGDPVHPGEEVPVRPRIAGRRAEGRALRWLAAEEFGGAVQPFGVVQLGQVEGEFGPLLRGREVVAGEGVDVGRGRRLQGVAVHGGSPLSWWARSAQLVALGAQVSVLSARVSHKERIVW